MADNSSNEVKDSVKQGASAIKGTAQAGKSAVSAVKTVKTVVSTAKATNPAGLVITAGQAAQKLQPLVDKVKKGTAALIAYLLLNFGLKMIGLAAGVAFGAVTGLPLLAIPGIGLPLYVGWTGFWGAYGFINPTSMINIVNSPFAAASKLANGLKSIGTSIKTATINIKGLLGSSAGAGIGATIGFAIAGPLGALIGAFVGGAIGFIITRFIIPGFQSLGGIFGFGIGSAGGLLGGAASFVTGLASAAWGGVVGATGGLFGALANAGSFLGFGGGSSTVAAVAVPTAIGATALCTIVVGVTTAATFFNPEPSATALSTGENEFFIIEKQAAPNSFENDSLPATVNFTIRLQAKEKALGAISVADRINVSGESASFSEGRELIPPCPSLDAGLPPSGIWECQFEYRIENNPQRNFENSLFTNTVTVAATPEGASRIQGSAVAVVRIGNPPSNCPNGWPMPTGNITQGPDGPTSHGDNAIINYGGLEAIDIGVPIGTPVTATISGVVVDILHRPPYNSRIQVAASGCANLDYVLFTHLKDSSISVRRGEPISFGQQIAESGDPGQGAHLHYQFNGSGDRRFRMEPPNIPEALSSRDCEAACNVNW